MNAVLPQENSSASLVVNTIAVAVITDDLATVIFF